MIIISYFYIFCNIALKVSTHLKLALKKHTNSVAFSNRASIKIRSHIARGYVITQNAIIKIYLPHQNAIIILLEPHQNAIIALAKMRIIMLTRKESFLFP